MEEVVEYDTLLDLCCSRRCRILLAGLASNHEPFTLQELTEFIERHDQSQSGESSREIELSLHHRYLPKAEAIGFVEYDWEQKRVRPTEKIDQWQPILSTIVDADPDLDLSLEPENNRSTLD